MNPDGVFLSNGPGDPEPLEYAVSNIRQLLGRVPVFGICLGHQLMGLAFGGKTYKLKFGHRGGNQPVKNLLDGRVEITAQNHGFAVDPDSLDQAQRRADTHQSERSDARRNASSQHSRILGPVPPGGFSRASRFALSLRGFQTPDAGIPKVGMPKRTDIKKILIIGSGPIVIGQACEFDYSGTQACKALQSEGFEVVLVNSNPATIMTDPDLADRTYIEPLTAGFGGSHHRPGAAGCAASDRRRPDGAEPLGGTWPKSAYWITTASR